MLVGFVKKDMDRISTLPNEIVSHILSFLSIKEAALTSLLSKRWRNRFAFAPDLHLSFVKYGVSNKNFIDFVDRVLAVSGNFPIRKFLLKVRQSVESSHISRWIINVTSRGIVDLDLDTLTSEVITLPSEIFTCKKIVKLKLGSLVVIAKVPENASLPALKTLFLNCVSFSGREVETLISACHVLEELTILGDPWDLEQCRTVSCPTLARLTLRCKSHKEVKVSRRLTFDTPSLAYLQYSDYVADEYHIVNLGSPVEAKLTLDSMRSISESNPKNLIKGLRNVEILNLSSLKTSEVFYSCAEAIPLLENLSRLSIVTEQRSCWKLVPLLLKMSPNLETLVIEGPLHFYDEYDEVSESVCECLYGYSFLLSCHVKVLEITKYSGTKTELDHMKRFLEKLPCLELVTIRACAEAMLPLATDLLMLPGACKIQFKFFPSCMHQRTY